MHLSCCEAGFPSTTAKCTTNNTLSDDTCKTECSQEKGFEMIYSNIKSCNSPPPPGLSGDIDVSNSNEVESEMDLHSTIPEHVRIQPICKVIASQTARKRPQKTKLCIRRAKKSVTIEEPWETSSVEESEDSIDCESVQDDSVKVKLEKDTISENKIDTVSRSTKHLAANIQEVAMESNLLKGKPGRKKLERLSCPDCAFVTTNSYRLERHRLDSHETATTFNCGMCDFTSRWKREFYRHVRSEHYSAGPPFCCEFDACTFRSDKIQNLLAHRAIHTNDKPFKCDDCGIEYSLRWNLMVHKRKHSGMSWEHLVIYS